jgi:hypothetical protein
VVRELGNHVLNPSGLLLARPGPVLKEARRYFRRSIVLERSAQGGGESDLSCLVKYEILYSVLR